MKRLESLDTSRFYFCSQLCVIDGLLWRLSPISVGINDTNAYAKVKSSNSRVVFSNVYVPEAPPVEGQFRYTVEGGYRFPVTVHGIEKENYLKERVLHSREGISLGLLILPADQLGEIVENHLQLILSESFLLLDGIDFFRQRDLPTLLNYLTWLPDRPGIGEVVAKVMLKNYDKITYDMKKALLMSYDPTEFYNTETWAKVYSKVVKDIAEGPANDMLSKKYHAEVLLAAAGTPVSGRYQRSFFMEVYADGVVSLTTCDDKSYPALPRKSIYGLNFDLLIPITDNFYAYGGQSHPYLEAPDLKLIVALFAEEYTAGVSNSTGKGISGKGVEALMLEYAREKADNKKPFVLIVNFLVRDEICLHDGFLTTDISGLLPAITDE